MLPEDATSSNDRLNLDSSSADFRYFREEKRENREQDSAPFRESGSRTLADLSAAENRRRRNAGFAAILTGAFRAPSENDDHIAAAVLVRNRELAEISGRELWRLFAPNSRSRIDSGHDDRRDDPTASSDSTPTEISFHLPS